MAANGTKNANNISEAIAAALVYTERAGGSNPSPPTNIINGLAAIAR